jgi:hypothetical protein
MHMDVIKLSSIVNSDSLWLKSQLFLVFLELVVDPQNSLQSILRIRVILDRIRKTRSNHLGYLVSITQSMTRRFFVMNLAIGHNGIKNSKRWLNIVSWNSVINYINYEQEFFPSMDFYWGSANKVSFPAVLLTLLTHEHWATRFITSLTKDGTNLAKSQEVYRWITHFLGQQCNCHRGNDEFIKCPNEFMSEEALACNQRQRDGLIRRKNESCENLVTQWLKKYLWQGVEVSDLMRHSVSSLKSGKTILEPKLLLT